MYIYISIDIYVHLYVYIGSMVCEETQKVFLLVDTWGKDHYIYLCISIEVLCRYQLAAMVKFALLRYLSELRLRVSSF